MKNSICKACYFLLLCALPLSLGAQTKPVQEATATPHAFVEEFYKWYVPMALDSKISRDWEVAVRERPSAFSSQLARLIKEDAEAQAKCADLVGLDFDPFLNFQDPAEHYEVGAITQTDQRYRAEIYRMESGKRGEKPDVIAEFSQQNGRWLFTNFYYPDNRTDLLTILKSPKLPCSRPRPSTKKPAGAAAPTALEAGTDGTFSGATHPVPSRMENVPSAPVVTLCSVAQTEQQSRPGSLPQQPAALVQSLYGQVVARHPSGLPHGADMDVFAPYLSKRLLHRIDLASACWRDWTRQDQERMLMKDQIPEKAPFGWAESGLFSGSAERTEPDAFVIERTGSEKDGSIRVYVRLTLSSPPPETWEVAAVLVREDGHFAVDDVIYMDDKGHDNGWRLSKLLSHGCDGSHWVGFSRGKTKQ
jgi:hypothetical protein